MLKSGDTVALDGRNEPIPNHGNMAGPENAYTGRPTIAQELEHGLTKTGQLHDGVGNYKPCTRIFLPAAKWKEFLRHNDYDVNYIEFSEELDTPTFHDIPVYSYSGDEIIYCCC